MAIKQLTDEQVRTMTLEEKDRWWLANVFRGNMPQLTLRSALTGMFLGAFLSLTNLYVGAKTGWTLGVGITSVILAFAMFKVLSAVGLAREFSILENNAMQSIATAAGYMTAPMISSLGAYMLVTGKIVPPLVTMIWIVCVALLGVLFAFPMKRRFINDEQHPFPEGRACGIVMDALHTAGGKEGMLKAGLLVVFGASSALFELLKHHAILERIKLSILGIPEALEHWFYEWTNWHPAIMGTKLSQLTITLEPDHVMVGAGGLMGIRTGVSLMIGACINYFILCPMMIEYGDILGKVNAAGDTTYGFRILTTWALWGGVALMTTASLTAFLSKPQMILSAFSGITGKKAERSDVLKHIELPMSAFVIGIPVIGAVVVYLAYRFFGVHIWMGAIAVPLVFVFALIGANSTALTSITPTGALGKLTQLTFGALAPGNITTNLMTAGITGEVASNSSNLLMDIKPGYMLGAKPRQQAMGHVLGIFAGALASVPIFYAAFIRGNVENLQTEQYPMPAVAIWKAVAEILTRGLDELASTAVIAVVIGAIAGIVLEIIKIAGKGRWPISAVGIGLAFVIPFSTCFAMFLGSFIFWLAGNIWRREDSKVNRVFVQNQEPICAGVIAGGALMGIAAILIENFVL